ncbi:MAG: hypothetical protein WCK89_13785 [bacterium]
MSDNDTKQTLPTPLEVLCIDSETLPEWLANYQCGDPFPRKKFFKSRIVYYPGSLTDGHPLRIFGKAHASHCFVYADYGLSEKEVRDQLENESDREHPKGYRLLSISHIDESGLTPKGYIPHVGLTPLEDKKIDPMIPSGGPFALWAVLERMAGYGESHGPLRISILHVGGDGYATFDALFCQRGGTPPYAVLLQDHGYGGDWNRKGFGGPESLLWRLARDTGNELPKWLFVATDHTAPWPGYSEVSCADRGGMYMDRRVLFRRI